MGIKENKADRYYIDNITQILDEGSFDINPRPKYKDGTPAKTKFITGIFESYDLSKNEYPLTRLRNTATLTGIREILWIYQKQSNDLSVAREMKINWWEEWNIGDGTIGNRYGYTVKKYDLMNKLLNGLEKDPFGRRHIINLYQEEDLGSSPGLNPCAFETLWSVRKINDKMYLDCTLVQRSNDYLMAGYINKIQYVALQAMVASHLGFELGIFNHFVQNLHIYDRHFDSAQEILNRGRGYNNFYNEFNIKPYGNEPAFFLPKGLNFYDIKITDFKDVKGSEYPKLSNQLEIAI